MGSSGPVDGEVTRGERYGLYVKIPEGDVIVLLPDVSKARIPDLQTAYGVGDRVLVRLVRFVAEEDIYRATMILDA